MLNIRYSNGRSFRFISPKILLFKSLALFQNVAFFSCLSFYFTLNLAFAEQDQSHILSSLVLKDQIITQSRHEDLLLTSAFPEHEMNRDKKRSIRFLTTDEINNLNISTSQLQSVYAQAGVTLPSYSLGEFYIFNNFIHGFLDPEHSRFWVAIIPKSVEVEKIYAQIEWFYQGVGAHMQHRMQLNVPILLLPPQALMDDWPRYILDTRGRSLREAAEVVRQLPAVQNRAMLIDGDLVYTLMALRMQGHQQDQWSPFEGLSGFYSSAYSFASTAHMAEDLTHENFVEQFELHLPGKFSDLSSEDQAEFRKRARQVLAWSLEHSSQHQESDIYNTIFASCINAMLASLYADGQGFPVNPQMFNPYRILDHLQQVELIPNSLFDKNQAVPSLNQEYGSEIYQLENSSNTDTLKKVRRLLSVVRSNEFDDVVRAITRFIVVNHLTHEKLEQTYKSITELSAQKLTLIEYKEQLQSELYNLGVDKESVHILVDDIAHSIYQFAQNHSMQELEMMMRTLIVN